MTDTDDRVERVARALWRSYHQRLYHMEPTTGDFIPDDCWDDARASIAAADVWLPIESAPKDGTAFLACWPTGGMAVVAQFGAEDWSEMADDAEFAGKPTHFMPIPGPPEAT